VLDRDAGQDEDAGADHRPDADHRGTEETDAVPETRGDGRLTLQVADSIDRARREC
jgi:hypothetical protein